MKTPCKTLLISLLVLACSCGASARQTAIRASLASVDAASDSFAAWSLQHQSDIVAAAIKAGSDGDTVKAEVASFRDKRLAVDAAFGVAYKLIAHAVVLDDDPSLSNALAAVVDLKAAIEALGASWPAATKTP